MLSTTPGAIAKRHATWSRLVKRAEEGRSSGVKFIFVKSVKIPARNFTDWNAQDQAEVDGALCTKLAEVMNV
jgi:hypothetical protein